MSRLSPVGDPRHLVDATAALARQGGRIVVTLRGEFDMATHHVLAGALGRSLVVAADDVVLDLRDARFMSIAAVAAIGAAERALGEDGRRLSVRAPSPAARLVLDLCGRGDLVEPHLRLVPDLGRRRGTGARRALRRSP
jgi:anti-anti-sigma factor